MRTRAFLRLAPALAVFGAATLIAVPTASAGLIDGSLNSLHAADHSNMLGALVQSKLDLDDSPNRRVAGRTRHELPIRPSTARCEVSVTVTDPDGAVGSVTAPVPASGAASTEIGIADQVSGTTWHKGDVDHIAGQLICTDSETGAVVGMVAIDEDRRAG